VWVVFSPTVSMIGAFGLMFRSLVSCAWVPKSVLRALSNALFPLPLSPVMRTMSVGGCDFDVVVKRELLVWSSPVQMLRDFAGSLCALCGAGLVAYVKRERGGLAVVGAFEFGDLSFSLRCVIGVSLVLCWLFVGGFVESGLVLFVVFARPKVAVLFLFCCVCCECKCQSWSSCAFWDARGDLPLFA